MKILYLSQYYPPEVGATQARSFEMTDYLAGRGHEVTVLCNLPNHPGGKIASAYRRKWISRERMGDIRIVRTWVYTRPDKGMAVRAGFYGSFFCSSLWAGSRLPGPFDFVYATSPPPLVGLTGLLLSRLHRARFIYEVRDLWLEMSQELGMIRSSWLIKVGCALDHLLYRKAHQLVVTTQGIYDRIAVKGWGDKLALIRNGSNPQIFYDAGETMKNNLGWGDKFVVLYAGVLGLAQGLDDVCRLAERFSDDASVHFVLIGDGPLRSYLEKRQRMRPLTNLTLLGERAREQMAEYISTADCCLVPLKKRPLFLGAVPSKMFDYMACARPVILSVDGEARAILDDSGGGLFVEPENIDGMAAAIRDLQRHPQKRHRMGQKGRRFVEKNFSRRAAAAQLHGLLQQRYEINHRTSTRLAQE
ncbi:glycosyltransferase family 4 protein [candidate division KSB1 bacterium]|nr:glycosyltransferase family 4 protein [candidate division KSB1 bacterium]